MELRTMRCIILLVITSALAGCASQPAADSTRQLHVATPEHYNVWVFDMMLERTGEPVRAQSVGNVGCCWKGESGAGGQEITLAHYPEQLWVHWFSFAEQAFYSHMIHLPAGLNRSGGTNELQSLTLGLAPGGTIVLWHPGHDGAPNEIARLQAQEISGNPVDFRQRTQRYNRQHADHVERYGLQLERW